jgi:branched-chain amino acid transport system ATP-binding protein
VGPVDLKSAFPVADSSETSPWVGVREKLMLKITNLETTYNDIILALKGISLEVPPKKIVAVLGSNGAGKTTTINTISGIRKTLDLAVQDGSIEFEGEIIHDREPYEIVAKGIVQVPEGRRIFAELTVAENILIGSYAMEERKRFLKRRDRVFHYFPILKERSRQLAGYLSGGEQQMLAISRALVASPKLMMMDEPSLGLAPILVMEIFEITGRINRQEGVSILLVEQNANMALSIAHYGYILENGRVVMEGLRERLREDRDIREFYLGLTEVGAKRSFKEVKHYKRRKRWLS